MNEVQQTDCQELFDKLGLKLVRHPLPFRLNHVNCFMAKAEEAWTIIDTGLNNDVSRELWKRKIGDENVEQILLTHYHPDHFGYAGGLQQKTGARLSMSKIDADAGMKSWDDAFLDALPGYYKAAGIPQEAAQEMADNTRAFQPLISPLPKVDHHFEEGEKIRIGRFEYEVLFVPGHSDGMVCFYQREHNTLLAADHILPRITPNISYWFHGDPNPLLTYMNSLEKIRKLDVEWVIPSHGEAFQGANKRIDELLAHHEERLDATWRMLEQPLTIFEVRERLFDRPLTVHEMRFAVGETLAHLEYLRAEGRCERMLEAERWIYKQT
ncbi:MULTISPECIES: MBL fold metallo-hydrolase [unclassified Planococcus (in: firmicutes)]|uniref:MBL fold metallo-hydrolase n=1 Tax=Planococcus TaxID=1372 RepID=UPI000C3296F0|nr:MULTISPECIES: MBL fold metallo-hydrolase [unclassified Planococcus (in: firmicutes)]AUD12807.1 MBL fold metallo-hydrolase [Planococcus sp. MB-3u-03]PKG47426.1 MBL fold metallo-hydrolase [Planococcus sp. Urea-trap-24]PKG88250.1 MBL fold metallo-hydrolase [Planococcus sp. Urea-3u-39]PKH36825.1 MBL fold metallo-hydrolase [Planococcus sp. MB-3u-09]